MFSNSELQCWKACPRKHSYAYIQLRRPVKKAGALYFGSMVHEMLETGVCPSGGDPFDAARARAMVAGYRVRWPAVEVLEREYTWTRGDWTGQADQIIRHGGRIMVGEFKTSGEDISPGSDYWERATISPQAMLYLWGMQGTKYAADTVLWTVLKKPAQRPKKAETADEFYARICEDIAGDPTGYYQRAEIYKSAEDLLAFEQELRQSASLMALAVSSGWAPKSQGACKMFGRTCEYLGVCSGTELLTSDRFETVATKHMELVKP